MFSARRHRHLTYRIDNFVRRGDSFSISHHRFFRFFEGYISLEIYHIVAHLSRGGVDI
jgi:hypothetical protein